jgi:hypothetical protein
MKLNDCMATKGWVPTEDAVGNFSFETTTEQQAQFLADNSDCIEAIGANLEPVKSEDEWSAVYEGLRQVHECLTDQGLDLPAPPSFQAWQDSGRNWGPFGDVPPDVMAERSVELERACPQGF